MVKSQNQSQKSALQGARNFKHALMSENASNYIAKVVKYDKKKHLADIQPLTNLSNGQKRAQVLDVPVAENCYIIDEILERLQPEFTKVDSYTDTDGKAIGSEIVGKYPHKKLIREGVPVIVAVLDRDATNWKGGRNVETFDPDSSRMHDINDSIIVGVLGGDAVDG